MALTESNMLPLGVAAPNFTLPDVISGENLSLAQLQGEKVTLVMFICNDCPFVIHLENAFVKLAQDYADSGLSIIAISSNDVENYPADSPYKMKQKAQEVGYDFPYLYDEYQSVAKAYDAACTPDFYLFDADLKLQYRGQFDDSRPGTNKQITGADLRSAIDAVIAGDAPNAKQMPSIGCNIKWK